MLEAVRLHIMELGYIHVGLHQGALLEKFKENNVAKVGFLKLLTKENPL